ncbi:hypothetical protein CRYUN_Cryun11dG0050200 [Craigia yunnanensis]
MRKEIGIGEDVKLVILKFGGQPAGWKLKEEYLPSGWLCLEKLDMVMPVKPWHLSYLLSLCHYLLYIRFYQFGVEMIRRDLLTGHWKPYLERAISLKPSYEGGINGGEVAANILQETAIGRKYASNNEDIFVIRAPGRLDVMGGIADYSGSLVLQMPIWEACHVAVQRNHPCKHRLWKHALAQQNAKGQGPMPVFQIVLYGSELSNRGPTFDMDLSDFMEGEQPISYEKAKKYFAQDPSQKWAAYVAGTILVLMKELGLRFEDSISILVRGSFLCYNYFQLHKGFSAVPEGKGVSSSASVEVASMSAIAAAYGGEPHCRSPSGVMDHMTSACGEANKLLAMVCQASIKLLQNNNGLQLLEAEASLVYLCNLSHHRYQALYAKLLPESMLGEKFLEKYTDHGDTVTVIDKKRTYGVTAAAKHPVYENFRVKCHYSYSACGLGSDWTERLVQLVQDMQLIQQRYKSATGYLPYIFEGSSPNAAQASAIDFAAELDAEIADLLGADLTN